MAKAQPVLNSEDKIIMYWFHCPGCDERHAVYVGHHNPKANWDFNGDVDEPTFQPSILVTRPGTTYRCHSYVQEGFIRYLSDCSHDMAGQTHPLPDIE